jgi:hypothetical protein
MTVDGAVMGEPGIGDRVSNSTFMEGANNSARIKVIN